MSAKTLLKDSVQEFGDDHVSSLAAALAYYAVFSLAPLLVIGITIAGFIYGDQAAQGQIVDRIRGVVGDQGASIIQTMIAGARKSGSGFVAGILSVIALILGASGVFSQLQFSLDQIWHVEPKKSRGIMGTIKDKALAALLVVGAGILVIALMFGSSAMWKLSGPLQHILPRFLWQVFSYLANFVILTPVFAVVYKFVPHAKIAWRDVWTGAFWTAILFSIGQFALGIYLGHSSFTSSFGLAGAVLLLLVWIYYSAQIFLFGGEMTQVHAEHRGERIRPSKEAVSTGSKPS